MKYKFAQPVRVGDLNSAILVDELEFKTMSLSFDPQDPVVSVVLVHKATGWTHNVIYTDSTAVEFWARTMEAQFDLICRSLVEKMSVDAKLPAGTLTESIQQ
jgi:hypothetical protein